MIQWQKSEKLRRSPLGASRSNPSCAKSKALRGRFASRLQPVNANFLFWLLIGFTLSLRLFLVLSHDNMLGVDGGQYLLSALQVQGQDETGQGFVRPLLAPGWLLVPFINIWGMDIGFKIFSALSSMLPLYGAWILSRRFLSSRLSLLLTAFLSIDILLMEMLVTGTLPLIAFTILLIAIYAIWRLLDSTDFSWKWIGLLSICIPLIAHVNQTTTGISLVLIPVFLIAHIVLQPRATFSWRQYIVAYRPVLLGLLLGGLFALTALPRYLAVAPGSSETHHPGPWIYFGNFPADPAFLFVLLAAPVALFLVKWATDTRLRAYGILMMFSALMTLFYSADESLLNIFYRNRYFFPLIWYPSMIWVFTESIRRGVWRDIPKQLGYAVVVFLLGLGFYGSLFTFHKQSSYSDHITVATMGILENLKATDPTAGIITNTRLMSLYVAALNQVPVSSAWTWKPPPAYTEEEHHVRCVLGWMASEEVYKVSGLNLVLGPQEKKECSPSESASVIQAEYVLIDTRFPRYKDFLPGSYMAPVNQWETTGDTDWLELVEEVDTVKLWRIRQ